MTLIYQSPAFQADPTLTATHVLLIGCGGYPGLARAQIGIGPLASPKESAETLAKWFLSGLDVLPQGQASAPEKAFHNLLAPLATVEMLTSPGGNFTLPSGEVVLCERPTRENLSIAFDDWLSRLGNNQNSRGIFYFCGHGISDGEVQNLVPDDVYEFRQNPLGPVFHFGQTCQVAIRRTKATLSFWIDACMEFSEELLDQIGGPSPLLNGRRSGGPTTRDWSVLQATTMNRVAIAPQAGVSHFTQALIDSLCGHCGSQYGMDAHYSVGAADLQAAATDFLGLAQKNLPVDKRQVVSMTGDGPGRTALHTLLARPRVHVEVDIAPVGLRRSYSAYMEAHGEERETKEMGAGPATFIKCQGDWTYGALAPAGDYPPQTERRLLKQAVVSWKFQIPI